MKRVTKEEFYKVINNLDVVLETYADKQIFKLRNGGKVIGKCEGFLSEEKFYELSENV